MLACASNSSILKILLKTGESGAKVHPWLHSESRPAKARLRPCLTKAKQKQNKKNGCYISTFEISCHNLIYSHEQNCME